MTDARWRQVERVRRAALAVDASHRSAVLDELCAGDVDLRRDVESLLAQQPREDRFLAAPGWQEAADALTGDTASSGAGPVDADDDGPGPLLTEGTRLGPYEVIAPLGAGGMGEVYRARDTRLDRLVALKILPSGLSTDPERRRRFEREARAVSALNDPHICTLHDVGSESGIDFLVMEHLEGETLAQRLRKGPLPLAQAVDVAAQIAGALAAAHRHGIIHRDLKPANVMLTKGSARRRQAPHVKLLDFGLAKLAAAGPIAASAGSALTRSGWATKSGAVLGTVPYMSPERLEGKAADARADLFAFGCVVYEMLTGRRAFAGATEARVISAIMTAEPPALRTLQPETPPALERLVQACLAKDPEDRWHSAHDVAEQLRGIMDGGEVGAPSRTSGPRQWGWAFAAVLLVLMAAGLLAWITRTAWRDPTTVSARVDVAMPARASLSWGQSLAFAPDGGGFVARIVDQSGFRLYWHGLDGSVSRSIPGTEGREGARDPFFSADGRHLAFVLGNQLVKLALPSGRVEDGSPIEEVAADIGSLRGASWGERDTILFSPGPFAGLWLVAATGGDPREVTKPDLAAGEISHRFPSFLPGGDAALFTILDASGRQDRSAIAVLSLESGRWRRIIQGGTDARYVDTGHIVYARNGALLAIAFDLETLATAGTAAPVLTGVTMMSKDSGLAYFDISRSGSLVFVPEAAGRAKHSLVWLDQNGLVDPLVDQVTDGLVFEAEQEYDGWTALSPGGETLAVCLESEGYTNVWAYHLRDRRWQPLTSEGDNLRPVWSPTGDRLAFASNRDGAFNLYVVRVGKGGRPERPERLTRSPLWQVPSAWSPDGRFISYQEQAELTGWNTWILPLDGDRTPWRWGAEGRDIVLSAFSPDGRWLAYQSQETGKFEVYVAPFPGPGEPRLVSGPEGGFGPVWGKDGREILYLSGTYRDNRILARDVVPGPSLRFVNPHVAFALPFEPLDPGWPHRRMLALHPDGRRVTMVRPDFQSFYYGIRHVTLIENWSDDVKAKVPPGGARP